MFTLDEDGKIRHAGERLKLANRLVIYTGKGCVSMVMKVLVRRVVRRCVVWE